MYTINPRLKKRNDSSMHFCVLAKALRMSGGDHIYFGIVVDKLEGKHEMI
jgi:ribulose-bisphosphate carboxylase large chain